MRANAGALPRFIFRFQASQAAKTEASEASAVGTPCRRRSCVSKSADVRMTTLDAERQGAGIDSWFANLIAMRSGSHVEACPQRAYASRGRAIPASHSSPCGQRSPSSLPVASTFSASAEVQKRSRSAPESVTKALPA